MNMGTSSRAFFEKVTVPNEFIDRFIDPDFPKWASFDPELGYTLCDCVMKDGHDGSYSVYSYHPTGERRIINYAEKPCRINTYGDSYTQGHQVSNGETWQEFLAAHLGEPIRNYGVGGYGVYQAYRRMLRTEKTEQSAEYVIINIFSDDHLRNVYSWRWLHIPDFRNHLMEIKGLEDGVHFFHHIPWVHVRFNPDNGQFEECENQFNKPESLYQLCDTGFIYEEFKNKFEVQAMLAANLITDVNKNILQKTADALEMSTDFSSSESTARTGEKLLQECAFRSTMYILEKARDYVDKNNKKLLIILSYCCDMMPQYFKNGKRFDQSFIRYLSENDIPFVDTLEKHAKDFEMFNVSSTDYIAHYHVKAAAAAVFGHLNPLGNHFFAFAVKDEIVEWLDPRPLAYKSGGE
jgi:hypothetical protein